MNEHFKRLWNYIPEYIKLQNELKKEEQMKVIDVNELLKLINYNLQLSLKCFEEIGVSKEVEKTVKVFSTTLLTMIIQESQAYEVDEENLTETEHDELLKVITNYLLMDSKDYEGEKQTYEC